MANDLRKVDPNIPIYQLAAPKYMWNTFGSGTASLIEARPDADFYGVTLVGGSHVDSMRGGNWLIQFSQQLVAGFSKPQNVAAASMLMVGWANDMFDGDRAEGASISTAARRAPSTLPGGQATLVDLPNSLRRPYILNFLEPFMARQRRPLHSPAGLSARDDRDGCQLHGFRGRLTFGTDAAQTEN